MNYNIVIEYTDNAERAGKLTLTDDKGQVVLSKVPVAIPSAILNYPSVEHDNLQFKRLKANPDFEVVDKSSIYKNTIKKLEKERKDFLVVSKDDNVIFAPQKMETNAVLQADRSAFIVAEEHFKPLYNISSAKDATLNMVANKVRFLWFPAKVASSSQNINTEYNHVKQTEKNLQEQLDIFNKPKVEVSIPKAVVPPKVKDVAKPVTPSPIPRNVGKNQQRMIGDRVHTQTTVYDNSNDIDALDIMFMYNYPNLAPMYKPNSMLAWYMFFDRSDTEMSRQTINNNVQQIAGFENVANADLKYHQSGYSVTMYEDEQKTKPLGVLNHDNNTGCYEMTSPSGEKTLLKVDDSGVISGCVSSPEKASTNFGFVEKDNGFVGNWDSSPTEGVKISSGMSVSEDYTVSSTPNETIDLGAVLRSNEEAVQNYKVESPKDEWVPPPPPPPPPPSSEWGSSDPYSNTASFKM